MIAVIEYLPEPRAYATQSLLPAWTNLGVYVTAIVGIIVVVRVLRSFSN